MKSLKIINEQEVLGKEFKMYGTFEEPLFLAKDVAEWIEHSDVSTMLRNIDEDEKVTNIVCTLGGNQKSWFLTENCFSIRGIDYIIFQNNNNCCTPRVSSATLLTEEACEYLSMLALRYNHIRATNNLVQQPLQKVQCDSQLIEAISALKDAIVKLQTKLTIF